MAGAPTNYSEDMLQKAQEYVASCVDMQSEVDTKKLKVKLPTKGGLAYHLGVHRDTLYEWAKIHPAFSDIMEQLGAKQEEALINNGLSGDYNPTIAKVLLTKHGYREGVEQDITSGGKELQAITGMVIQKEDANKVLNQES
jgi:hypothetical protein